jgi:hypothetical protein
MHPPHLEPEMEMTQVEFFLSCLVFPITGWMEHIMRPTRSYSVLNSGRDFDFSSDSNDSDDYFEQDVAPLFFAIILISVYFITLIS